MKKIVSMILAVLFMISFSAGIISCKKSEQPKQEPAGPSTAPAPAPGGKTETMPPPAPGGQEAAPGAPAGTPPGGAAGGGSSPSGPSGGTNP